MNRAEAVYYCTQICRDLGYSPWFDKDVKEDVHTGIHVRENIQHCRLQSAVVRHDASLVL